MEGFLLERLQLSREEEEGLLDHEDGTLWKSGGIRRFNMNAMKHSSRIGRVTAFAEAVRLLDWMVVL